MYDFAPSLVQWYRGIRRDLPWRHNPTPYAVWVSEIMLQQTRVDTVRAYYLRWMEALPTVTDLHLAGPDLLRKLWEGLGYYTRVANLQKAAHRVVEQYGGVVPRDVSELQTLPGVGEYTAGAIASIAYGLPVPAVDGNVLRVLARFTGDDTDILTPAARARAKELLTPIIPKDAAGDFTQAMFEWGALVCVPANPRCEACPVREHCYAYAHDLCEQLPVRVPKTKRTVQDVTVWVVRTARGYALTAPKEKGLLAGTYGLPYVTRAVGADEVAAQCAEWGIAPDKVRPLPVAKHVFSHITWRMTAYRVEGDVIGDAPADWVWASPQQICAQYAVPSAFGAYKAELI